MFSPATITKVHTKFWCKPSSAFTSAQSPPRDPMDHYRRRAADHRDGSAIGRSPINNVKTRQALGDDLQRVAFHDDVPATGSAELSGEVCIRGIVPLPCRGNASARNRHSPG
jgi:hypothetical protein